MDFRQSQLIILFISSVLVIFISCENSTTLTEDDVKFQIELEIIPYTDIPSDWDSAFYQHDTNWDSFFDTTGADSLAEYLKETDLPLGNMWFPQVGSICGIPIRNGSEVILKLTVADTSVYQFGFQHTDGFPLSCVSNWRHYKYVRD